MVLFGLGWATERSRFESWQEQEMVSLLPNNQTETGSSPASCYIGTGVCRLPGGYSCRPQSLATVRPGAIIELLKVRIANFSKPDKVSEDVRTVAGSASAAASGTSASERCDAYV